jgi:hypothetical protein
VFLCVNDKFVVVAPAVRKTSLVIAVRVENAIVELLVNAHHRKYMQKNQFVET